MQEALFCQALGLAAPWAVKRVALDVERSRIDLFDDRAYQIPTAYIDPVTRQMRPALRAVNG